MNNKIKIGAVSYLNTRPLLYGLQNSDIINEIELELCYPSILSEKLKENSIDIALLPVASIPEINGSRIVSNYGIASDGHVTSVAIFSKVPIHQIKRLYLDYQSKTSVILAKILLKHYWKVDIEYLNANENYIEKINGQTSGLIIGDRALEQLDNFEYVYDLSTAWKIHTGLDFIFAAWVSNKKLSSEFIIKFNNAILSGIEKMEKIISENHCNFYDLRTYYTKDIKYIFDENKTNGMSTFLEMTKLFIS